MRKIWDATFYCDVCKQTIERAVYSDNITELSDKQKETLLNYSKELHYYDKHLSCWNCKKHIKPHEIESIIPLPNGEAGDLCKECTKKYKEKM